MPGAVFLSPLRAKNGACRYLPGRLLLYSFPFFPQASAKPWTRFPKTGLLLMLDEAERL